MVAPYNPMQSLDLSSLAQASSVNMPASAQLLGLDTYNPGLATALDANQSIIPGLSSNLPMAAGGGALQPTTMQTLLGGKLADGSMINGMLPTGLGLANSLFSGWMGMKNYGLAKDQLKFAKSSFNKNFQAQANLINSELEDRQRKRVRTDPDKAQGVAEYMSQYGVKA